MYIPDFTYDKMYILDFTYDKIYISYIIPETLLRSFVTLGKSLLRLRFLVYKMKEAEVHDF